ncbi:DUF262 domain-containing protein [Terracidiphilus gabretensis]|uniref:DUF262 domain-containing protein n=1 Tax=Terracidiphilus gabretensis TaxID=1577687 RepID=UPI00071B2E37|nr:DUF262 domain-containing protein [Terracidiphilus gabretensis]
MIETFDLTPGFVPSRNWMPSILEQYRVSDFLEWHQKKALILNPDFQRGDVWSPAAKTFLIDTILRQLPIPKVYLRTRVDVVTKKSIREVVDGQQRLRAIMSFAEDGFALSKRASEFAGKKYSTLTPEQQESFLGYAIAVDQLLNASTDDVLEVFARLNSYTVTLNAPEKRHGKYQGEFKWAVRNASRAWASFWEEFDVLSVRERVRMMDDSLTAEMFGVLLEGVKDGGQPKIDTLYNKYDSGFDAQTVPNFNAVMSKIRDAYGPFLKGTSIMNPAPLLMLFSAVAYSMVGIPSGDIKPTEVLERKVLNPNIEQVQDNLLTLASVTSGADEPPEPFVAFWKARDFAHKIASRRVRFPEFVRALTSESID